MTRSRQAMEKTTWKKRWTRIRQYRFIYLLMIPVVVYFVIFSYYPMGLGIYNSLQEIKLLGKTVYVGLKNYQTVLASPVYAQAFVNTLVVGIGTFVLQFLWGLSLAIVLNELRRKVVRSVFQTVSYIPNLLSWSVVASIWITILSPTGLANGLIRLFGGDSFQKIVFMAERSLARPIMIFTGAWKSAGYTAALFLAAIVSIDPTLYEAAEMDGATRLQEIGRITLPAVIPTVKVVVVLGFMGILRNFDQIYVMANSYILDRVRNLLYLIYNDGIVNFKIGPASAAATLVLLATMVLSFTIRRLIHYDQLG